VKEKIKTKKHWEQKMNYDIDLLLVDDDPAFLNLTARHFEKHRSPINLRTCESPEKALKMLEKEKIDCVISDFKMPEMNGIELLEKARSKYPNIPFIMLTSEGSEEIASKAISSGVTDYIKKGSSTKDYKIIIKRIENVVLKNKAESKRRKEQRQKKENMKQQMKEFSRMVSHDLKNPLEVAKGYVELAEESGNMEDLRKAEKALNKTGQIIEDLRFITIQPEDLEKENFHLENVFRESYNMIELNSAKKSDYSLEDTKIYGSRSSVASMLNNLIKNSIQHNTGEVKIRAGPIKNGFFYEDDGKGINSGTAEKVLKDGFTTSENGQGLGLYLVKKIADLHCWDIEITESNEGGARFEFYF